MLAQGGGFLAPDSDAVFRATWVEATDRADAGEVRRVLAGAGLDAPSIRAAALDLKIRQTLRAATEEAIARGIFCVPTFFAGERMRFGQDRLPDVEQPFGAAVRQSAPLGSDRNPA